MKETARRHTPSSGGILYIVGTPIGNLEDITIRALRILKEVDCIAAEDTRTARKLLGRYEIKTPTISYYDARERQQSRKLIIRLKSGESIALISEAGMPGISDPGYRVVTESIREGIPVVPVPGPSALLSALVISGLPTDSFIFEGFLPPGLIARKKKLFQLQDEGRTLIFYESPRRLIKTLEVIRDILGERKITVARELTKMFEEVIRGTADEVLEKISGSRIRGEIVLVVEGRSGPVVDDRTPAADQIKEAIKDLGITRMEAIKLVAGLRGMPKSELYRDYHKRSEFQ
ncbi:MAG: 16S rRNA (cytidine(1402)-2'-O)-methyltransferase [Candidatus Auribacterota bacterium]|nr:16S rRNA (cytidine(1402)-2'-O)-methyltransferase [Candidatus Auribacterota bacterium]